MKKLMTLALAIATSIAAMATTPQPRTITSVMEKSLTKRVKALDNADAAAASMAVKAARTAGFVIPSGEFKSLGTGSMTDDMLTALYNYLPVTFDVEIQQSVETPTFYRVIAPYGENFANAMLERFNVKLKPGQYDSEGKCVLNIDASDPNNVYFPKTMVGCDWGHGEMYIGIPTTAEVKFADGIFTAPMRGVAVGDDDGATAQNVRMAFRIVLPGVTPADYRLELMDLAPCLTSRQVSGKLIAGNDIAKVKYYVLPNTFEDEMVSLVKEVAKKGADFNLRGDFTYEMDYVNKETIILVGLDKNNNTVASTWQSYYYVGDADADDWEDCGTALFTDAMLKSLYNVESSTMECKLQRNKLRPDYLRLVNPYEKCPYATERYFHSDHNHYIYIAAEDPECIYVEESPIGLDFGHGQCRVWSMVGYFLQAGYELDECKELELGATLTDDNTLVFPDEAMSFSAMNYDNGDWYTCGEGTQVKLPENFSFAAGVCNITADNTDNNAPVEYFNLQGQRVDNPVAGSLLIRRQGTTVTKHLVR